MLDTSVVVAFMNRRDDDHERVAAWMQATGEDLLTTPLIVAEIDHLVSRGGGLDAARAFYEDLASGAYLVEWWPEEAMTEAVAAARRHEDIGFADASLLTLAARLGTARRDARRAPLPRHPPANRRGGIRAATGRCVTRRGPNLPAVARRWSLAHAIRHHIENPLSSRIIGDELTFSAKVPTA